MNLAFQVSNEDIENALDCTEEEAERVSSLLDYDAIEKAALYGDDMDKQTTYAYEEIQKQYEDLKQS